MDPTELRHAALRLLCLTDPVQKAAAVRSLDAAALPVDVSVPIAEPPGLPGRPQRPRLVPPKDVPTRSPFTTEGRCALLHAIAHIEFNAINLGLDAVWRFAGMPEAFYRDWWRVASEEALHFTLLREHLVSLGADYGLWTMARRHARAVEILGVILRDEIGHVAIGNRWYRFVCERDGLDPLALYPALVERHGAPRLRPPFNDAARRAAGFSDSEIAYLTRA